MMSRLGRMHGGLHLWLTTRRRARGDGGESFARDVVIAAAVIALMAAAPAAGQPVQWPAASGGNDHWYELVAGATDWPSAKTAAEGLGAHLATITSEDERLFIVNNLTSGNAWLGGFQGPGAAEPADDWELVTGEPFVDFWNAPEPNNSPNDSDCLELRSGGFNDRDCAQLVDYLVEYETDTDGDGVLDVVDNCPSTPNGDQGDMDGDGAGDVCDRDTLSSNWYEGNSHSVQTPFYGARVANTGDIFFGSLFGSVSNGSFRQPFPSDGITLEPGSVSPRAASTYAAAGGLGISAEQGTWNHVVGREAFRDGAKRIRSHHFALGNSMAYGVEIPASELAAGEDYSLTVDLDLSTCTATPCGLNPGEVGVALPATGIGRLSIFKATDVMRIGTVKCTASGAANSSQDNGGTYNPVQAIQDDALDAGEPEREQLVQSSYQTQENTAADVLGTWTVEELVSGVRYRLTATCPASFVDVHRQVSDELGVGFAVHAIFEQFDPVNLGSGQTINVFGSFSFDAETVVTGTDVTFRLQNPPIASPPTFDHQPTDYTRLPNNGGTCALQGCADEGTQAVVSFSGAKVQLAGMTHVSCPNGCGGMMFGSGDRVGPNDGRLVSEPARFKSNRAARAEMDMDDLSVDGASFCLQASCVDVALDEVTCVQGEDPACTGDTCRQFGYGGLAVGCDASQSVAWNPGALAGQTKIVGPATSLANCACFDSPPSKTLTFRACTEAEVGANTCTPEILDEPLLHGGCTLTVNRFDACGLGDICNPGFTLLQPSGTAIDADGCDKVEVGGERYDTLADDCLPQANHNPSVIRGWTKAVNMAAKKNVSNPDDHPGAFRGIPLAHLAALNPLGLQPVATTKACLHNLDISNVTNGLTFGRGIEARVRRIEVGNVEDTVVSMGGGGATLASRAEVQAAGGDCPAHVNGIACKTNDNDAMATEAAMGSPDFRALTGDGLSMRTKVVLERNLLGLRNDSMVPSSGQNAVMGTATVNNGAISGDSGRTLRGRDLELYSMAVTATLGSDTAVYPQLLEVQFSGNTIGLQPAAIVLDNRDVTSPSLNCFMFGPEPNCGWDGTACAIGAPVPTQTPTPPPGSTPTPTPAGPTATATPTIALSAQVAFVVAEDANAAVVDLNADANGNLVGDAPPVTGPIDDIGGPIDQCPADPNKTAPGVCGCGVADTDSDLDGTADCNDGCPNNPTKTTPGVCGCGVPDTDSDNDGTPDCNDGCPNNPTKTTPGVCGCGVPDTDSDNDGTPDCNDGCPNDANKTAPGICGCGVSDADSDGDGTPDCNDGCPNDANKTAPGVCGCGVSDADSDGDGAADCNDGCPNDPTKVAPGQCGCGVPDADSDNDGTPDCNDGCPNDANKTAPGVCGCGVSDADTDGDGAADCNDGCPNDPTKVVPGVCGCGVSDADSDGDGLVTCFDNCPEVANPDQTDTDQDGEGDSCDATPHHADCVCGTSGNHGKYVVCVVKALKTQGAQNAGDVKSAAANSNCKNE
jgi:Thrombospondin type 3 repeat/Lectin C-type domain